MTTERHAAERWAQIAELLDRALDLPAGERMAFVRAELVAEPGLSLEVEELVEHSLRSGSFLDGNASELAAGLQTDCAEPSGELDDDLCGKRLGRWRILHRIGVGGMGHVYLAERADGQFEQRAALKVVPGALGSPEMLERFLAERQILAGLNHPNIAGLLDGGISGAGLPFLVMEYVNGRPITEHCDETGSSIPERLDLFRDVCAAVASAHSCLVVHRDLKPGNIFVAADGTVKLLDFGIARMLEPGLAVEASLPAMAPVLTPAYAAPEQLLGMPVTTAADVYSLGVVLYQLLTGRLPHGAPAGVEAAVARAVRGQTAPPPSSVAPRDRAKELRGDLDAIVLRALRTDPAERYACVEHLADDLRAYLSGRPVSARRATPAYLASRLIRRHRVAAAAVVVATAALVGGAAALVQWANTAERERRRSERVSAFLGDILRISDPGEGRGYNISAPELIDHSLAEAAGSFGGEPEIHVRILRVLGNTAHHLQLYQRAVSARLQEVRLERRVHGEGSPELAWALARLGQSLLASGDIESGAAVLQQAKGMAEEAGRRLTPEFVDLLIDGGLALRDSGEPTGASRDRARELLQEAVEVTRRLGDAEGEAEATHALVAFSSSPEETVAKLRAVLALRRRNHPEPTEGIARTLNDLALALEDAGDRGQGLIYAREALAMHAKVMGEDHPTTIRLLSNMAGLLRDAGDFAAAEPLYRRVLEWRSAHYPPDAMPILYAKYGLARVAMGLGRLDEAERGLRHVVEELQRRRSILRFVAQSALGECLARRGRQRAALRNLREAAEGTSRTFGPGSQQAREAMLRLERFAPADPAPAQPGSDPSGFGASLGKRVDPAGNPAGAVDPVTTEARSAR